jgi:hypothetical protein
LVRPRARLSVPAVGDVVADPVGAAVVGAAPPPGRTDGLIGETGAVSGLVDRGRAGRPDCPALAFGLGGATPGVSGTSAPDSRPTPTTVRYTVTSNAAARIAYRTTTRRRPVASTKTGSGTPGILCPPGPAGRVRLIG